MHKLMYIWNTKKFIPPIKIGVAIIKMRTNRDLSVENSVDSVDKPRFIKVRNLYPSLMYILHKVKKLGYLTNKNKNSLKRGQKQWQTK